MNYANIPVDILKLIIKIKNGMNHYEKYKKTIETINDMVVEKNCDVNHIFIHFIIKDLNICKTFIIKYDNRNFCLCPTCFHSHI